MRFWLVLLGGMLVWTVHFFSLYALASLFESSCPARIGTLLVTLACLAADIALLTFCVRLMRAGADDVGWAAGPGASGAVLSLVAVAWQGLPALFV